MNKGDFKKQTFNRRDDDKMGHIKRLVHASVEIELNQTSILIDPGRYCFKDPKYLSPEREIHPKAQWLPSDFQPDVILFTHGHGDHFNLKAAVELAKRALPKILSVKTVVDELLEANVPAEEIHEGDVKK